MSEARVQAIGRTRAQVAGRPAGEPRDEQTDGPLTLADRLPAPVDTELAFEAREALRALADLRWRRRRVLAMKVAGFSYREIMERLGSREVVGHLGHVPCGSGTLGSG